MKKIKFAVLYPGVLALETKRVNKLLCMQSGLLRNKLLIIFLTSPDSDWHSMDIIIYYNIC